MPLRNDDWDESADTNRLWKNHTDLYKDNCGKGDSTPKTLKKQANFNNKLLSQLGRRGDYIVYNTAGDNLYAARLSDNRHVVTTQLFYVPCASRNESFFLMAVLNANSLLQHSRQRAEAIGILVRIYGELFLYHGTILQMICTRI